MNDSLTLGESQDYTNKFTGITVDGDPIIRNQTLRIVVAALRYISELNAASPFELLSAAMSFAEQSLASYLDQSGARCEEVYPHSGVATGQDASGNRILKCFHVPAHTWDFTGKRLS